MVDLEKIKEKYQVSDEHNVSVTFSLYRLDIHINKGRKIMITDPYPNSTRKYNLRHSTTIDKVISSEEYVYETVKKAKKLESLSTINGWTKVEPENSSEFLKYVNLSKEITLELNSSDVWKVGTRKFDSIKEAKFYMTDQIRSRNPVKEILDEVAFEKLEIFLKNVDGIGQKWSRRLVSKSNAPDSKPIESFTDINFRRPRKAPYSIVRDARNYLRNLEFDPIEEAVKEKKRELVQEHDQYQLVSEAL